MDIDDLLEIGTIVAPQGLKGKLKVRITSDFPERFEQKGERWLKLPHQAPVAVELIKGQEVPGKGIYVISLAGVDDRTGAEKLKGATLYVDKNQRPSLASDEYHVNDLIGLEVYHQQNGENIGIVTDVFSAGNDILEVTLHKQPDIDTTPEKDLSQISRISKRKKLKPKQNKPVTVLIPFVEEIVPIIDLEQKIIKIDPPLGLLKEEEAIIMDN